MSSWRQGLFLMIFSFPMAVSRSVQNKLNPKSLESQLCMAYNPALPEISVNVQLIKSSFFLVGPVQPNQLVEIVFVWKLRSVNKGIIRWSVDNWFTIVALEEERESLDRLAEEVRKFRTRCLFSDDLEAIKFVLRTLLLIGRVSWTSFEVGVVVYAESISYYLAVRPFLFYGEKSWTSSYYYIQ